jgi:hypothetical protein
MSHAIVLDLLAQLQSWDDANDPQPLAAILADGLGDLSHPDQLDIRDLRIVESGRDWELWVGTWKWFALVQSRQEARARYRDYLLRLLTVPCPRCGGTPRTEAAAPPGPRIGASMVERVRTMMSRPSVPVPADFEDAPSACFECHGRGFHLRPAFDL